MIISFVLLADKQLALENLDYAATIKECNSHDKSQNDDAANGVDGFRGIKEAGSRYGSTGSCIEVPGGRDEEASGDEATTLNLGPASYLASAPTDGTG